MRILGIDPGSIYTGYGIIRSDNQKLQEITSGRINLSKMENLSAKLKQIFQDLNQIIQEHKPEVACIEKTFHSKNAHSAMVLNHARGVAMLACSINDLTIYEYTPTQVKVASTGFGKSDKEQVRKMVSLILGIQKKITPDQSDALAVSICHSGLLAHQQRITI